LLGAEILRQTARIGTSVQLPDTDDPLWAEIDLTPSLLGRIGLFLLKIPAINITLTLEDGRVIRHRYIPAIGERGFLLSPYIETTDDFVLLASGNSINHTVRSIRFDTSSPKMWCRELTIRLRRMNRPAPAQ